MGKGSDPCYDSSTNQRTRKYSNGETRTSLAASANHLSDHSLIPVKLERTGALWGAFVVFGYSRTPASDPARRQIYPSDQPMRASVTTLSPAPTPLIIEETCAAQASRAVRFSSCPIMALIDTSNAAAASADMVQDRFRNFQTNAKPLQTGRGCAA